MRGFLLRHVTKSGFLRRETIYLILIVLLEICYLDFIAFYYSLYTYNMQFNDSFNVYMIESYNLSFTCSFKNDIPEYRDHLDGFPTLASAADPLGQIQVNVFPSLTYLPFK